MGSLAFDYIYKVDHLVRSGETIAANDRTEFAGGKGLTQSISLARAGAEVYHAGKVGSDGIELRYKMNQFGVNTTLLLVDGIEPTGHSMVQVDPAGQSSIVTYGGANDAITRQDIDGILANFRAGDMILLQNEISNVCYAIEKAYSMGLQITLNPSPFSQELLESGVLQHVDYLILNEIEGHEITGSREPEEICECLIRDYPNSRIVLTLGAGGVRYRDSSQRFSHGIFEVPVIDATGAGDTFVGYFLTGITEQPDVARALTLASKAASLSVTRNGSADSIPSRREVDEADLKLLP